MSALANLRTTGRIQKPPRLMIYGPHKIGKSTFGASAPSPIFLQCEDGLDGLKDPGTGAPIEIPSLPGADYPAPYFQTLPDFYAAVNALLSEEHEFNTVVIDSADWLEAIVQKHVCDTAKVKSIEDFDYGKGYEKCKEEWRYLLAGLNALRDHRGMAIILLAHAEIKKFKNPSGADYDRYQPKLDKRAGALIQEAVDIIGFANWEAVVVEEKTGFNQKTAKAKGAGKRILYTEERPSYLAGNRYGLPPTIDFNWPSFAQAFAAATAPAQSQAA